MAYNRFGVASLLYILAGIAVGVSAGMPWLTLGKRPVLGFEYGTGKLLVLLGAIAIALSIGKARTSTAGKNLALCVLQCEVAAFAIALTARELTKLKVESGPFVCLCPNNYMPPPVSVGFGMYVALAGACLLALASFVGVAQSLWLVVRPGVNHNQTGP